MAHTSGNTEVAAAAAAACYRKQIDQNGRVKTSMSALDYQASIMSNSMPVSANEQCSESSWKYETILTACQPVSPAHSDVQKCDVTAS